jgi:hypothetical protein
LVVVEFEPGVQEELPDVRLDLGFGSTRRARSQTPNRFADPAHAVLEAMGGQVGLRTQAVSLNTRNPDIEHASFGLGHLWEALGANPLKLGAVGSEPRSRPPTDERATAVFEHGAARPADHRLARPG